MSTDPCWISKKVLLMLHEESLAWFGGERGLRDEALLDTAIARPKNIRASNADSTIAQLAAAYAFGLAKNHAFVDGNKRVAFLSIGLFLAINGYRLTASPADAIQTILRLASGELSEPKLAKLIHANMKKS